ncbi:hypothetical protein [Streptomyces sp. NPDC005438]|uniref:hypothetical protein n=1 Tax=Streptomyces sp. NPDC005438 TaxID=3156880 RepID=UPI0033A985DB
MRRHGPKPFLDDPDEGLSPSTSHPAFVAVAPPWCFDEGDPSAPFGSDDGHDTLRDLEEWYASGGGDEHAPGRVAALVEDWGLVPEEVWDRDAAGVRAWLDADDAHIRFLHGEVSARLAGALGQFKIAGHVHPALRSWAEQALAMAGLLEEWERGTFGLDPDPAPGERRAALASVLASAPQPGA